MNIRRQIKNLRKQDAWLVNQALENIIIYGTASDIKEALAVAKKENLGTAAKLLEQQLELEKMAAE